MTDDEEAAVERRTAAQHRQAAGLSQNEPPRNRAGLPPGYQQRDIGSMVQWVGDGLGNGLLGYVAVEAVRRAWSVALKSKSGAATAEPVDAPDVFYAARQQVIRLYGQEMAAYGATLPILPVAHAYDSDGSWAIDYRSDEPVTYTVTFRPRRGHEEWSACIRTTASRRS